MNGMTNFEIPNRIYWPECEWSVYGMLEEHVRVKKLEKAKPK